jgi:hypothetical protein
MVVSGPLLGIGGICWRDNGRFVKVSMPLGHAWLPAGCITAV